MKKTLSAFILLGLMAASCTPIKIVADYDRSIDFNTYKTFNFLPWHKDNSRLLNDFDKSKIYSAITKELEDRGYKKVMGEGDLAINIMLVTEKKTAYSSYSTHYNHFGYGYHYPFGFGHTATYYDKIEYMDGSLIIDMIDNKQKKLVWQGTVVTEVDKNPENKEQRINRVASSLFAKFPVEKK